MKKLVLLVLVLSVLHSCAFSQYWQQQVNYTIEVALNDKEKSLKGFEKIEYNNHSPDTLSFIWFHLWPNAYKTDKTAYSDQALENGDTRFYFSNPEQKGYINRLDFKVDGVTAVTEDHPQHLDIVKLLLPDPLPPGKTATITTPFHVKLPFNFSRGGYDGESFQVTQWYPKPAVYDREGWHPMPYLDQGEYYSEFGNFDVRITVPENYAVAATGELMDEKEKQWLKTRAGFEWKPIRKKIKKGSTTKYIIQEYPVSSSEIKTLRYRQENVHDFAWFADKRFIVNHDTLQLASGKIIDLFTYYTPAEKTFWNKALAYAKDAVSSRSQWIGEYPYSTVSVVQGPESFGGGMEYPTITVISPMQDEYLLDYTIAHEIGHNWFYGILGNNERKYPWLDEGLNTYYDNRYSEMKYGDGGEIRIGRNSLPLKNLERLWFETKVIARKDQPINTRSEKLTHDNYGLVAYYKTGAWLEYAEEILGKEVIDRAMQSYYSRWKFRHPQPGDLKQSMEEASGKNLDSLFTLLDKQGMLPQQQRTGTKTAFVFDLKALSDYVRRPSKNLFLVGPAAGFNSYDKLMIGGFLTNVKLPPSRFQFLLAPMYGTGSKKLAALGMANYSLFPQHAFQRIDLGIGGTAFSINRFTDQEGNKTISSFSKFVPTVKFTLQNRNFRSNLNRFIQFKTFFINEDALEFYRDTVVSPVNDTTIFTRTRTKGESRTLNQLLLVAQNSRALYPYRGELKFEQGDDFIRAGFTGNYFFNYPKEGGLDVRFFAGKFIYTGSKTSSKRFQTGRYHLNMTGPNGYEDYTYSNYFAGRNEFEGASSQQIMIRDGGFKIRTELLADKIGKTDDWLMAVNFSSSIPSGINPLQVLPIKIPLKVFADIGTYAAPWKRDSKEDRFLFDAGLQVPLLGGKVNIYIPLLYSSVYKDYIRTTLEKKNRFLKTLSFSIDITGLDFLNVNRKVIE